MAAAAGTALLRSVATRMGMTIAPRAPSLHHPPLFAGLRGARPGPTSSRNLSSSSSASSGSTPPPPPPINNKEFTQTKNVTIQLSRAKAASLLILTKVACVVLVGTTTFMYLRLDALMDELNYLRRERSILIKAVEECQRTHIKTQDVLADSSQP